MPRRRCVAAVDAKHAIEVVVAAGAWSNVQRANYTYYAAGESFGAESDLKTASTESWKAGEWQATGTSYYRYERLAFASSSSSSSSASLSSSSSGSSSSSSGSAILPPIPQHPLKFVLNPASYDRMVADGYMPETSADGLLATYADFAYEYDASYRVIRESVQGGSRTYSFDRTTSNFPDGYNSWRMKTVETLPDSSQNIVYSNYAGQPMLKVFKSGADEWYEFWKFDDQAQRILHAHSSAISGYDETKADLLNDIGGNYQYLRDYDGLIDLYTYHAPSGKIASVKIRHGELGDCFILREYEYVSTCDSSSSSSSSNSAALGESCVWFTSKFIRYPEDGLSCGSSSSSSSSSSGGCINAGTRQIITTFDYAFYPGTSQLQRRTTTLPPILSDQNGPGTVTTQIDLFDESNNAIWMMNERGFITRQKYDIATRAPIQRIDDVDTSLVDDAPPGWHTPAGGGLHIISNFEHDAQGRTTQVLGPVATLDLDGVATSVTRAKWWVYNDFEHTIVQGVGYATGTSPNYNLMLANPVSITKADAQGRVLEQIAAVRYESSSSSSSSSSSASGSPVPLYTPGKLSSADEFPQYSYVRWTTTQYTDCCFIASQRTYHTIPQIGTGSAGLNYDEADFGYDVRKRRIRSVSPGGTINRVVLDPRGLVLSSWTGTNDTGATPTDPTGGGAPGNNMVNVFGFEYDDGTSGGNGNRTSETAYVDGSNSRTTLFGHDFRNRHINTDKELDFYEAVSHFPAQCHSGQQQIAGGGTILVSESLGRCFAIDGVGSLDLCKIEKVL